MSSADVALAGVYEISKLLTSPAGLRPTLSGVLSLLSSFLDMRHALIALLRADGVPELVVGASWDSTVARQYFDSLPERVIGQIVVGQSPLVIERLSSEPLFESWDFSAWDAEDQELSFIGVPIKDRGRVVGTLTIDRQLRTRSGYRLDDDVRFLTMIANLIGQTVRLHRLIARDRERLMDEQHRLTKAVEHVGGSDRAHTLVAGIIGESSTIRSVLEKIRLAARSHSTVLLRGESGTGKEMFANALHELSPRNGKRFVAVNCAALSESVLESELFGHERGAFTGAVAQRKGRFELADGGTLFLDEIGEISQAFQAKLLRVLQLGEFERVGGTETLKVDVRLVAATNRDLEAAVAEGSFRADLYYRVNVVPIFVPPLRERPADIGPLALEFLRRFDEEHGVEHVLTHDALSVLTSCAFPGNVRELENCVRRTATLAPGSHLRADDFACRNDECLSAVLGRGWRDPRSLEPQAGLEDGSSSRAVGVGSGRPGISEHPLPDAAPGAAARATGGAAWAAHAADEPLLGRDRAQTSERERLISAMEASGWVQAKAARLLGITPRQIGYALRKHGIEIKKF